MPRTTLVLEQMGKAAPYVRAFDPSESADNGGVVFGRVLTEDNGYMAIRFPLRGVRVYKLGRTRQQYHPNKLRVAALHVLTLR